MAFTLQAKFSEDCCDCKSMKVYDLTGDGATGYGGSNPAVSDVTLTYLYFKVPGSDTWAADPITISATLPSSDPALYVTITNEDLGYDADSNIPDGYWEFRYQIQGVFDGSPFIYSYTKTVLFSCVVNCCRKKSNSKLKVNCNCDDADNTKIRQLDLTYQAMIGADNCGNQAGAQVLLEDLQRMCEKCGCGC